MRNLNVTEVNVVSGGVGEFEAKMIRPENLHPVVDAIAKFFTALELVLRPVGTIYPL